MTECVAGKPVLVMTWTGQVMVMIRTVNGNDNEGNGNGKNGINGNGDDLLDRSGPLLACSHAQLSH